MYDLAKMIQEAAPTTGKVRGGGELLRAAEKIIPMTADLLTYC